MVKTFTAIHYVCQMNGNSYQRGKKVAINVTRHFYNLLKKKKISLSLSISLNHRGTCKGIAEV